MASSASADVLASLDLAKTFGTRSPWTFTATQGPPIADPLGLDSAPVPGAITLCLSNSAGATCAAELKQTPRFPDDLFVEPHYLEAAEAVRPRPEQPLLLIESGSLHGADGDQLVLTQLFAYDRGGDRFLRVYEHATSRNNNQEVRFIKGGPLHGAIVVAEPTQKAPFNYWVTVSRFAAGRYTQVLRYRSATRYADGNPLAVIDSEMPSIQQRLGLWRSGMALPLPRSACAKPHVLAGELWCG